MSTIFGGIHITYGPRFTPTSLGEATGMLSTAAPYGLPLLEHTDSKAISR